MSETSHLDQRIAHALDRIRTALHAKADDGAPDAEIARLNDRVATLEAEKAELADELERLREKRDKDVAALDELIAQLKPLIEEV